MNTMLHPTPLGAMVLLSNGAALTRLAFSETAPASPMSDAVIDAARRQLDAYFERRLRQFNLPLAPQGTGFQQRVWAALLRIPYGETRSYRAQAEAIGAPRAVRAVGLANARNPIALIVPCHRVIGADGALTGYAAGLERKRFLLALERGPAPAR